jgi:hypothetical protein
VRRQELNVSAVTITTLESMVRISQAARGTVVAERMKHAERIDGFKSTQVS